MMGSIVSGGSRKVSVKPVGVWLPFPHALWSPSVTNTELGFVLLDPGMPLNIKARQRIGLIPSDSAYCVLVVWFS